MTSAITVDGVTKRFEDVTALDGVGLDLAAMVGFAVRFVVPGAYAFEGSDAV